MDGSNLCTRQESGGPIVDKVEADTEDKSD